ncbi:helix-turn-helix domain-containing protein [Myxococcota bacterium]|nr:helix-turn-helix domain-containing protein [Myxococcota bacterium]
MISERIKRARLAAGLSQREAAKKAQLSAMAISKFERGDTTPTSKTLIRLAQALETRIEFFFRPDTLSLGKMEYRKRSSLGKKQLARIEADVLDQVERFLELISLFPKPPIRSFEIPRKIPATINSFDDVEKAALIVRNAWSLGTNQIPDIADTLESHGILVFTTAVDGSSKFDGIAARVNDFPIVVVGGDWPGDRQRFTLSHELGHLILGGRLSDDMDEEKACDRFAGAFLAPKSAVIKELGAHRRRIEPRELYQLKHDYGLSMLAWVFRARDVGIITPVTFDILMRMFSSRGWRKKEPRDPYPSENAHLFEQLVVRALAEEMISMSKAAELMSMSASEFREQLSFE